MSKTFFGRLSQRSVTLSAGIKAFETEFPGWASSRTASGKRLTRRQSLQMIAVYSCISLVADGISSLPAGVWDKGPDGSRLPATGAFPWLARPNLADIPMTFWNKVIVSLLMDGNAFIATLRNDRGEVLTMLVLDPARVEIDDRNPADPQYVVDGVSFDRTYVLHIPAFTVPGEARGMSPLQVAQEAIGLGLTAEEYGARFFGQGTTMAGVIEHPGNPQTDEAVLLREMFKKSHSGIKNSHAVGVLTGGAKWQSITVPPEQAQFLDTRRFQKSEIALLYRVPAFMVDPTVTSTWGTGIEEQNTWFVQQTLMPWITRIEQTITRFVLPGSKFFKFNVDARLRPKTKERMESYAIGLTNGIYNADEVRAWEDLPPIPGGAGKNFHRPMNLVNADPKKALDQAKKLAEAAPKPAPSAPDNEGGDKPDEKPKEDDARSVVVNVSPPVVNISPAEVRVDIAARNKRIVRNESGEIVGTEDA